MNLVPIPHWSHAGLLPPVDSSDPTSWNRSPYRVRLTEVIDRFATTPQRCRVLSALLTLRSSLHRLGYVVGFQWINGSFVEHVEALRGHAPRDIDVVSFVARPPSGNVDFSASATDGPSVPDENDCVDHYIVELDLPPEQLINLAVYWSGVWSHRRSGEWKGFLEIDLSPDNDPLATERLGRRQIEVDGGS